MNVTNRQRRDEKDAVVQSSTTQCCYCRQIFYCYDQYTRSAYVKPYLGEVIGGDTGRVSAAWACGPRRWDRVWSCQPLCRSKSCRTITVSRIRTRLVQLCSDKPSQLRYEVTALSRGGDSSLRIRCSTTVHGADKQLKCTPILVNGRSYRSCSRPGSTFIPTLSFIGGGKERWQILAIWPLNDRLRQWWPLSSTMVVTRNRNAPIFHTDGKSPCWLKARRNLHPTFPPGRSLQPLWWTELLLVWWHHRVVELGLSL